MHLLSKKKALMDSKKALDEYTKFKKRMALNGMLITEP